MLKSRDLDKIHISVVIITWQKIIALSVNLFFIELYFKNEIYIYEFSNQYFWHQLTKKKSSGVCYFNWIKKP